MGRGRQLAAPRHLQRSSLERKSNHQKSNFEDETLSTAGRSFLIFEALLGILFLPAAYYALRNGKKLYSYLREFHQSRWSEISGQKPSKGDGIESGRLGDRGIRYVFSDSDNDILEIRYLKSQARMSYLFLAAPFILTVLNFAVFILYLLWSGSPDIP